MNVLKRLPSGVRSRVNKLIQKPPSKPTRVVIELTNRCNLNCPFCLVGVQEEQDSVAHDDLKRPFGTMEISLAEKIIRYAKEFGMNEIMLTFQGEPLLHKKFIDIIRISKKYGLKTHVFTNGLLLNQEISRKVIREGLDSIRFSVDGATEETYRLNRVGGSFKKVYQNMAEIVQIAKEEKSNIELMWQFIAMRNNEHEIEDAKKMAKLIGLPLYVKTFAESVPELVPRNPKYRRRLQRKPCKDIYRGIFVYWNGDVVPCCYDLVGKEIIGNIADNTLKELWDSDNYVAFRKKVNEAVMHPDLESELCKSCLKWAHPNKIDTKR
jgi:radical SAM protein with 4Fe4S-binding SPASM domain